MDGTNPKSRFSCKSGCFSFDVDENLEAQPLTDGLLVIRHLFGFSGDSLTSGAVSGEANRDSSEAITGYLTDADSQSWTLTAMASLSRLQTVLLLIRYLFGFSGDSLISGAIGSGAERIRLKKLRLIFKSVCLFSRFARRCLRHAADALDSFIPALLVHISNTYQY